MYQNCIAYPSSLHIETQARVDEFITRLVKQRRVQERHPIGPQSLGPLYSLQHLQQEIKVMQNKLIQHRTQINKELSDWIASALGSYEHVVLDSGP